MFPVGWPKPVCQQYESVIRIQLSNTEPNNIGGGVFNLVRPGVICARQRAGGKMGT